MHRYQWFPGWEHICAAVSGARSESPAFSQLQLLILKKSLDEFISFLEADESFMLRICPVRCSELLIN